MKLGVVVNPSAGRRHRPWRDEDFCSIFRSLGIETSIRVTRRPGDARRLASEIAPDVDVICIVGGDGTVHEVVNGMMPHGIPIALLPSGCGNDLASLVDCPKTPRELARVVHDGWAADLDLVDFGDRYCVNSAGLGFEGLVNRFSHGFVRVGGRARYVLALARALRTVRCPEFTIVTSRGDEIKGKKLLVSIGNGHRTGGAFYLTPEAFPDDGLVDVCIVEGMSRAKLLRILPKALDGSHTRRREVVMLRTESLTVEATEGYPMHVDGEYVPSGPERREIVVRPATLTVLCGRSGRNKLVRGLRKVF